MQRIFVEKKPGFRVEAENLREELNESLSLSLREVRLICVYDLEGFSDSLLEKCSHTVFGETVTDIVSTSIELPDDPNRYLAVEYLPGQFDQRASSAVDCVHLIEPEARISIRSSKLFIFDESMTAEKLDAVRHYYINAVECREKDLSKLTMGEKSLVKPLQSLEGFRNMPEEEYPEFCRRWGLAMNTDDLAEVVRYFIAEKRDPTETEIRILDTYWSDHCRHTTFTSELTEITVDESFIKEEIESELGSLHAIRKELGREGKSLCLMEIATIGARYLKAHGKLDDLEQSEENNACSIFINVDVDGRNERWLLQFKNETHNHPTEIEPFGGAATCLGGAIRDPLSGRSYVYQAMRVTGAGDILKPVSQTIPGKLPQKVITRKAAAGYSSYGNQIGLATTHVREIYHPGYVAKRLEVGAVAGAVKAENVRRERPEPGDVILLLGGRTGRDGIGGATGSSKEHTEASLETCGSEVQKGNAPEERKLQRLFRRPEVTRLIRKSNDFGAGGVSVAIGELSDGLDIYLDRVPVKYEGLNASELAISESQERMAVVVGASDREQFESYCASENIEVTHVADVTSTARMRMFYGKEVVADLSREFIDSAGARHYAKASIAAVEDCNPFEQHPEGNTLAEKMLSVMSSPNVASQQGLVEMFDSTIGRSTVLMPYGGLLQLSESQVSVQKIPTDGFTDTASIMSFGFNPCISEWSPYHGAAYAVVEACAKAVAAGADWSTMRFSYQEYFERMTSDPHSWGKPLSALLGALKMQKEFGLPSIGGKDSMSGTFEHINVPPTLIAFGITTLQASRTISPELKWEGHRLYLVKATPLANRMPDVEQLKANWNYVHAHILSGDIVSAWATGFGSVAEGLVKMSFGNALGVRVKISEEDLFNLSYGSIIVETERELSYRNAILLGEVTDGEDFKLHINGKSISSDALLAAWQGRYAPVFANSSTASHKALRPAPAESDTTGKRPVPVHCDHPRVYIPVFPGTNCDYDTAKAFRKAGAEVEFGVFRNLSGKDVTDSIEQMCKAISNCQILALAGGFSAGDEPDGSGKFIASVLCNASVAKEIDALLGRGGLILGICNGFQALVKSGLLPYGKCGSVTEASPTLFRNDIDRHVSRMVTTRVASVASPWLAGFKKGDLHAIAVSHGEGKFVVSEEMASKLFANGQVAFQYADPATEEPTMEYPYNPNGSYYAIEGIISPSGQILGKMGHSERWEPSLMKNIPDELEQTLFDNAVKYFQQA
ncbi:MAG: phosphoribosylformylglycinamidine synthase [Candidatus Cryptobacteroides sp.]|nr:phosphoribosylformylglycinamidine synthase [Candidatus Cryptobacteroides sp.]